MTVKIVAAVAVVVLVSFMWFVANSRNSRRADSSRTVEDALLSLLYNELCEIHSGKELKDNQNTISYLVYSIKHYSESNVIFEDTDISIRESAETRERLAVTLEIIAYSMQGRRQADARESLKNVAAMLRKW